MAKPPIFVTLSYVLYAMKITRLYTVLYTVLYTLIVLWGLAPTSLSAQRSELGIGPSALLYTGDLNAAPELNHTKFGGHILYRFHLNNFSALRFTGTLGQLTGDDSKEQDNNILAQRRQHAFNINLGDISATFEYYFLDYHDPSVRIKGSPYIFAGIGGMYFWGEEESTASYSNLQVTIPFGIGYRQLMGRYMALSVSAHARKTFFDYLDNTSADTFDNKFNDQNRLAFGERYSTDWYYSLDMTLSVILYRINCPPGAPLY